jgi:hypothetical protein
MKSRHMPPLRSLRNPGALALLVGLMLATAVTAPAQTRRALPDDQVPFVVIVVLALTVTPVILGIKAAKRKGISPHWMWFGLHPLGGWIAYLIIRSRPDRRYAAPSTPPTPVYEGRASAEHPTAPAETSRSPIGLRSRAEEKAITGPSSGRLINRGDRQDDLHQAFVYWTNRFTDPVKDPFVMYLFDAERDAREALLELPCIHEGEDGKLICTEPLIFGYYRQSNGQYEAVICGHDLTHDLWERAKISFEKHGGRRKNDLEPESPALGLLASPSAPLDKTASLEDVVFVKEERQPTKLGTGMATYRIHRSPNEASARAFLEAHPVTTEFLYLVVETPEGNFGRDLQGIYAEPGSGPIARGPDQASTPRPMSFYTMFKALSDLCYAYQQNDRAEISRLEPIATMIGEELNRRGGKRAMLAMWESLENRPGARTLDMHWNGIGEWRG